MESLTDFASGDDSPVLEATETTQKRRQSRQKRQKTHKQQEQAMRSTNKAQRRHVRTVERDAASSSRSPSPATSPNVNASKKKGCKKSSAVWNHCNQKTIEGKIVTYCNYCENTSWILAGSTSTALYHIKQHHVDKLTPDEL